MPTEATAKTQRFWGAVFFLAVARILVVACGQGWCAEDGTFFLDPTAPPSYLDMVQGFQPAETDGLPTYPAPRPAPTPAEEELLTHDRPLMNHLRQLWEDCYAGCDRELPLSDLFGNPGQ